MRKHAITIHYLYRQGSLPKLKPVRLAYSGSQLLNRALFRLSSILGKCGKSIRYAILFSSLFTAASAMAAAPSDREVLEGMTKGVDEHLTKVVETADALDSAVKQLCSVPDEENLQAARTAWKKSWQAWSQSFPYLIEPANHLTKRIGTSSNATVLKAVVESNEFAGMRQGKDVRGYAAVEYLLFEPQNSEAVVAAERCPHLTDITDEILSRTSAVKSQWDKEYREEFISAGNGQPYLNPEEAMSHVVAETLNVIEDTVRERIGFPTNFLKGKAKPELLDAPYSRYSLEGLQAIMDGVSSVLLADGTNNLLNLVATRDGIAHKKDPELAKDIKKQLKKIDKSLEKIRNKKEPLFTAIVKKPSMLKDVYKEMSKLEDIIAEAAMVLELDVKKGLEAQMLRQ